MGAKRKESSAGLVRDLINQFEDPLTFYRELIQNSIDAGSNRIDVTLRYEAGRPGRAIVQVEDDGEGMDERVIDEYLLVLFSSTKENDYTKIGKFGIGFLSVFAPKPELVRVYTAKNGESWRIDFPSPKRYDKYRVSALREGTLVELVLRMPPRDYPGFVDASRRTIERWCRHSEANIHFRDKSTAKPAELITEEFGLPGGVSARHAEEGTEVVLAFSGEEKPFFGFYNKGLTLKEGRHAHFPGVAFKVKSRYLEHTLTRDNVLEDENYRKAMGVVRRLVDEQLPGALRRELEAAASEPGAAKLWEARLPFLARLMAGLFASWSMSDWRIFPSLSGGVTLSDVEGGAKAEGKLFFDAEPSRASRALEGRGVPVLRDGPWLELLERRLSKGRARASAALVCPAVPEQVPPDDGAFLRALRDLDARSGAAFAGLLGAEFGELPPDLDPPFFVAQREPGKPYPLGLRETPSFFKGKRFALLNVRHPTFRTLAGLFARRPALAAFLALKIIHLHDGPVEPAEMRARTQLADRLEERLLAAALELEAPGRAA